MRYRVADYGLLLVAIELWCLSVSRMLVNEMPLYRVCNTLGCYIHSPNSWVRFCLGKHQTASGLDSVLGKACATARDRQIKIDHTGFDVSHKSFSFHQRAQLLALGQ